MSMVMDNLGMDYEIIENLNLTKIWQLQVATLTTCDKSFISSRVSRGSALVELSGVSGSCWFKVNRRKKVYYLIPYRKNF